MGNPPLIGAIGQVHRLSRPKVDLEILLPVEGMDENLQQAVHKIHEELSDKISHRFLICENKTSDTSFKAIKNLAEKVPIRLFQSQKKKESPRSTIDGLKNLQAPFLLALDSDAQFDPEVFWRYWDKKDRLELVSGARSQRADPSLSLLYSKLFKLLFRILKQTPGPSTVLHDPKCPFVLIRQYALQQILPQLDRMIPSQIGIPTAVLLFAFSNLSLKSKYKTISIAAFGAVFLTFGYSLSFEFVNWDDNVGIYENIFLYSLNLRNLLHIWLEAYEVLYMPLTTTIWGILGHLSKYLPFGYHTGKASFNPALFHFTNVLLHYYCGTIIFRIINWILKTLDNTKTATEESRTLAALLGTFIFLVHPLQAEPVSWATGLKDILSGALILSSIWTFLSGRHGLSYLIYFLALFTKPVAVITPIILKVLSYFVLRESSQKKDRLLIIFVATAIPFILINSKLQSDYGFHYIPSIFERLWIALDSVGFYLSKLVIPFNMTPLYLRTPSVALNDPYSFAYCSISITLITLLLCSRLTRFSHYSISFILFLIPLLPVLGFLPFGGQNISTVFDRYMYLSMMGVSLTVSFFSLQNFSRPFFLQKNKIFALIVLIILLGVRASNQSSNWKNSEQLYKHAILVNPEDYISHSNLGTVYRDSGRIEEAKLEFETSIKINSEYPLSLNNLSSLKAGYHPEIATMNRQALTLAQSGQYDDALLLYKKVLAINSRNYEAIMSTGIIYAQKGDIKTAIEKFEEAIDTDPTLIPAYQNLIRALELTHRTEEANFYRNRMVRLIPDESLISN